MRCACIYCTSAAWEVCVGGWGYNQVFSSTGTGRPGGSRKGTEQKQRNGKRREQKRRTERGRQKEEEEHPMSGQVITQGNHPGWCAVHRPVLDRPGSTTIQPCTTVARAMTADASQMTTAVQQGDQCRSPGGCSPHSKSLSVRAALAFTGQPCPAALGAIHRALGGPGQPGVTGCQLPRQAAASFDLLSVILLPDCLCIDAADTLCGGLLQRKL